MSNDRSRNSDEAVKLYEFHQGKSAVEKTWMRHKFIPITAEQFAKYAYPDGPAKEKDPDGT